MDLFKPQPRILTIITVAFVVVITQLTNYFQGTTWDFWVLGIFIAWMLICLGIEKYVLRKQITSKRVGFYVINVLILTALVAIFSYVLTSFHLY